MRNDVDKPVMVAVGGREADSAAIGFGLAEARRRESAVELVHVVPGGAPLTPLAGIGMAELRDAGREVLDRALAKAAELADDVEVSGILLAGSPVREITAAGSTAQLVVVGRSVHRGPLAPWSGRTAVGVCSHSHVPVVVVPGGWEPTDQPATVVVGVAADTLGVDDLGAVLLDAVERGTRVVVVHAWHVPDPYVDLASDRTHSQDWELEGGETVADLLDRAVPGHAESSIETSIRHGYPGRVLLEAAAEADLVVLPRRRHLLSSDGHLGSTAREVIHRSQTPVLVLPAPEPEHRRLRARHLEQAAT